MRGGRLIALVAGAAGLSFIRATGANPRIFVESDGAARAAALIAPPLEEGKGRTTTAT